MAPTTKQSGYNIVRDDKVLLDTNRNSPPSFVINLFPGHWTLNNGPMFMYNNQVSSILEDIRAFRIPADFVDVFDRVGVQYYEGCLIVELVDYRPPKPKDPLLETPDIQRVVCRPNSETIWKDICRLNEQHGYKMTDMDALEIEAKILLQTSHPLCLNPDPHLTRVVNNVLRASTPNIPNSLKRKASLADLEEDEAEKAKRAKLMQFMNPRAGRAVNPTYRILAFKDRNQGSQAQGAGQPPVAPRPSQVPAQVSQASAPVAPEVQDTSSPHKDPMRSISATPTQPHVQLPQQHAVQQPIPAVVQQPVQRQPQPPQQPIAQHMAAEVARRPTPVAQSSAPSPRPTQPPSRPISTVPQQNSAAPPQPVVQQLQFPAPPANFLKVPPPVGKRRPTVGNPPAPTSAPQNPPPVPAQLSQPSSSQQVQNPPVQVSNTPQNQAQQQPQPAAGQHPTPHAPMVPQPTSHHQIQMAMAPFIHNRPGMMAVPGIVMQPYPPQALQQVRQQSQSNSGRSSPANTNSSPIRPSSATMSRSPLAPNARPAAAPGRSSPLVGEQVARPSPMVPNRTLSAQNNVSQGTPQPQPQQLHQPPQQQQPQQPPMQTQQPMQPQQPTQQQLQQHFIRQQQQRLQAQQQQLMQQQQSRPPTAQLGGQMQMTPQPHIAQPHVAHPFQMPPQMFQYQNPWQYAWAAQAQAQQVQQARQAMAGRGAGPIQMSQQQMLQYQQFAMGRGMQGQQPNR